MAAQAAAAVQKQIMYLSQDGMAFVGPSAWLDEQDPTAVDTYHTLKAKWEVKFAPTIKTSTQIINKIQTTQYSPDKTDEELITEIDEIVGRTHLEKNPVPILGRHEDMDVEQSAKMQRKLADKCARLERELEEQRQLTNLNWEAQKRWENSDDANKKDHKPIKEESNGSFRCWNCCELGHSTSACAEAGPNWNEREVEILQKASSSEPRGSAAESDDEYTFILRKKHLFREFPENLNNKEYIQPEVVQTHEEAILIHYSQNQQNADISLEFGILQNG
ncbi:hypothetical protein BDD12DRAFT_884818 [Trichophaea hybrida]|nr:hypothetical protein BDD12DRAFT_884818 [Trichophaea hybrida]